MELSRLRDLIYQLFAVRAARLPLRQDPPAKPRP